MNFIQRISDRFCFRSACFIRPFFGVALIGGIFFSVTFLSAQPSGANVISGAATVTYNHGNTTVTAGNNSVLRWNSFDVAPSQTVQFIQPTVNSRVLNWIGSATPSQIDGTIRANGQVYLLNPAGVYFGRTAVVDAARLYAVGGSLSKEDFFAGNDRFTQLSGGVRNEGLLHASTVALIGRTVVNSGTIVSPDGFVALASGDQVYLGKKGSSIYVDTGAGAPNEVGKIASGVGVTNSGTVDAGNGSVALAAGDLYSIAISHTGSLRGHDIRVQGQGQGAVRIDGLLDVSSAKKGTMGGYVEVTGQQVNLSSSTTIDASGAAGGGTILIGGDAHGANPTVRNAESTFVDHGAVLKADSIGAGDGGRVIVWSDGKTDYRGDLFARSLGSTGKGGFAEVSGLELSFRGTAHLTSRGGMAGTLLLDPFDLTISNAPDSNIISGDEAAPALAYSSVASPSTISWATILDALTRANLVIHTSENGGSQAGNITIAESPAAGTYNRTNGLSLSTVSGGGIFVNAPVINAGTGYISLTAGTGGIALGGTAGSTLLGTKGFISLASVGPLTGLGTLQAGDNIRFDVQGGIGSTSVPIVTNTSAIVAGNAFSAVQLVNGPYYLKNIHDGGLALGFGQSTPQVMEVTSKDSQGIFDQPLNFSTPGNAAFSNLRLWGSDITIGGNTLNAATLSLGNSGNLSFVNEGNVQTLRFENSGNVNLGTNAPNLVFDKSGGGATISANAQVPVTLSGNSPNSSLDIQALGGTGQMVVASASLAATRITLRGGVSGAGTVTATETLILGAENSVGTRGTPLSTKTPFLQIGKSPFDPTAPNTIFDIYVSNSFDGGLIAQGNTTGTIALTSLNALGQSPAPLALNVNGMSAKNALELTLSSLTLGGDLRSSAITINHSGSITRPGTAIITSDQLSFIGTGDVGANGFPIWTAGPMITIDALAGSGVYIDNGKQNLGLNFSSFSGGGSFLAGNLTILSSASPLNVGTNSLTFTSSGNLDLGNTPITAGTLTLAHDRALLGYTSPTISTLVLGGAGDDGTSTQHFISGTPNLTLNKTQGAHVYLDNLSRAGLTLSGSSDATLVVSSFDTGDPAALASLTIAPAGLRNVGSTTLSSAALTLSGGISGSTLTLNTTGAINGSGALTAPAQLILNGTGDIGASGASIATNTPSLVLNRPTGAVYVDNGSAALELIPTTFTGGGAFRSGDLTLRGPIDVGLSNNLAFLSSGSLALGANGLRANTLTLAQDGLLSGLSTNGFTTNTLILGGAGDDGTSSTALTLSTGNLVLAKTGSANVYFDNRRDGGLSLSGSANAIVALRSLNTSGTAFAPLIVGSDGARAGGALSLDASSLSLQGPVASPTVALNASDLISGVGTISASGSLTLRGTGEVGTSAASVSTVTPAVTVDKSSGRVFLDNGAADLALTPIAFAGGGSFSGANISLLGSITAGTNSLAFTANGELRLGASNLAGGNVTLSHRGALTGTGTISADQLTFTGTGEVGTSVSAVLIQTPWLVINKSGGSVFLDDGSRDLAFTPTSLSGGVALSSGSLSLLGGFNAGEANVSFTTSGGIDLKGNAISANQLTLNHGGALSHPGSIQGTTLTLGGAGDDGLSDAPLVTSVANLVLNKTGSGNVYLDNKRDAGLSVVGTGNAVLSISSLDASGANAQLTVGSAGITTNGSSANFRADQLAVAADTASGSVIVTGKELTVNGAITSATVTVNNSGPMSGTGVIKAGSQLNLGSTGDVGTETVPIQVRTPSVVLDKLSGAVYIDNGQDALALTPNAFSGGGAFTAGSFSLRGPINVNTNNLTISTIGALDLREFTVNAATVTFRNGGPLSVSDKGGVSAVTLDLGNGGIVGTPEHPLVFSGTPNDLVKEPAKAEVHISFFGGKAAVLSGNVEPAVSSDSRLTATIQQDEQPGSPDSDSASNPGRASRRGGAAFRAISAKADVASAAREQLRALGVYARPLRLEERLSRERKEAVFVTVPERERPKESDFEVVDARIDPAALREVLRLASEIGLTDPSKTRLQNVAHSLTVTYTAYSATSPAGEASGFRAWLEARRDADATIVLNFVKSLRSTLQQIELLGLTYQEIEVSKAQIFGSILRTQLNADPDFLRALVEDSARALTAARFSSPSYEERLALR